MPDDEQLLAAWAAGDLAAGGCLVDRHLASLHRFFSAKVTAPTDVEDLVGDTMEACVKARDSFRADASFRTFLFSIAHYTLCRYIRRKRRLPETADVETTALADLGPGPSTLFSAKRERQLLVQALRSLPLMYQVALELKHIEGMSRSEIAAVLKIAEGTVATRLRVGGQRLDAALASLAESPGVLVSTQTELAEWAAAIRAQRED